jgi:hypothetical protein
MNYIIITHDSRRFSMFNQSCFFEICLSNVVTSPHVRTLPLPEENILEEEENYKSGEDHTSTS